MLSAVVPNFTRPPDPIIVGVDFNAILGKKYCEEAPEQFQVHVFVCAKGKVTILKKNQTKTDRGLPNEKVTINIKEMSRCVML